MYFAYNAVDRANEGFTEDCFPHFVVSIFCNLKAFSHSLKVHGNPILPTVSFKYSQAHFACISVS
jgi:hypothetical protein